MPIKDFLINKLLHHPLSFSEMEFRLLVSEETGLNFNDLREMVMKIFNINESILLAESTGNIGIMGILNRCETARRRLRYRRSIRDGFRSKTGNRLIVAEGDSWFQFPVYVVKDILKNLSCYPEFLVYSLAFAGDWLTEIIHEGKYVEELSIHKPDVFLISGGGNDFVGSNRIALMTIPKEKNEPDQIRVLNGKEEHNYHLTPAELDEINAGMKYITKDFHALMLTLKAQYYLLFRGINKSDYLNEMLIITQGYDYVIPSSKNHFNIFRPVSWLLNYRFKGEWLDIPLKINGISDPKTQRNIMKAMIFGLNEVFGWLAAHDEFKNVYHIDCRGVAEDNIRNWFDEIHLKSRKFKIIAKAYKKVIDNYFQKIDVKEKIFYVKEKPEVL